jgi:hypothetical protein
MRFFAVIREKCRLIGKNLVTMLRRCWIGIGASHGSFATSKRFLPTHFPFEGKQQTLTVGEVTLIEARQWKAKAENLLMRVRQRMLEVPAGCTIKDFILHEGKPPALPYLTKARNSTLDQLREAYVKVFSNGAIELKTLATAKIHLNHIEETLGKTFPLPALTLAKLQEHIERRRKIVAPVTIKKEIDTFRAVWNWGQRNGLVGGAFPSAGLVYPKSSEVLPYMRWGGKLNAASRPAVTRTPYGTASISIQVKLPSF